MDICVFIFIDLGKWNWEGFFCGYGEIIYVESFCLGIFIEVY